MTYNIFAAGILAVLSCLVLWFKSPLKLTLGKIIFKQNFNNLEEFDDWLFMKNKFLGKLLSCWICCSFWLSLLVGVFLVLFFNATVYSPLITFFCYPSIAYLYYKFI